MPVTVKAPAYLMSLPRSVFNALTATDQVPSDAVSVTFEAPVAVFEYVVEALASSSDAISVTVRSPFRRTAAANAVSKVAAATDQFVSEAVNVTLVEPVSAFVYAAKAAVSLPDAIPVTVRAPTRRTPAVNAVSKAVAATDQVPSAVSVFVVAPVLAVV